MISDWIFILGSRNHAFLKTEDNWLKLLISSTSAELRASFWEKKKKKKLQSLHPAFISVAKYW